MSVELWRIAASTPGYRANDLSGTGAAVTGGRWNEPNIASIALGSDWLRNTRSTLLDVPSVIVPEERNVLINPGHPDAGAISADIIRLWDYDRR